MLKDPEIFNLGYEINSIDISLCFPPAPCVYVRVRACVCVSLCDDPVGHLLTYSRMTGTH
jgi:hypothetical protein